MKHPHPYIVLEPDVHTNTTGKYLVVRVEEWVAVSLGEKETYTYSTEHGDYPSAATDRDRLNERPEEVFTLKKSGISLSRERETVA